MPGMKKQFVFARGLLTTILVIQLFTLPNVSFSAVANITQINFVTEEQTVAPGIISKVFTIQTQNDGGEAEAIDETSDLEVSVTSPTGQFNSNATNWNPNTIFTMSKNTANKNFYFKDSSEGEYVITAKLVARTTGQTWTTTQAVTISTEIDSGGGDSGDGSDGGSGVDAGPGEAEGGSGDGTSTTTSTSTTPTATSSISTHYGQESVSTYKEPTSFQVTSGRNRLGYIGLPFLFEAKSKVSSGSTDVRCKYFWNTGDGYSEKGRTLEHYYKYTGDYNLVLNGECGGLKSISRTIVKVVEPNLVVSRNSDGSVKVQNNGDYEINLFSLQIVSENENYVFPLDTIVSPKKGIDLPSEYTGLSASAKGRISLESEAGQIFAQAEAKQQVASFSDIAEIPEVEVVIFLERLSQILAEDAEPR
jgi:hypothetical protein